MARLSHWSFRPHRARLDPRLGLVSRGLVPLLLTIALVPPSAPAAAQPASGGSTAMEGTVAARDYVAPVDFEVVDAPTTAAIAAAAGEHVPVVIRPDPRAADEIVAAFNDAFHRTRTAYLDALEATFGSRSLDRQALDSVRFRSFTAEFQAANPGFPVNLTLAETWARGLDGESIRERLALTLRAITTRGLIGEVRPASTVYVAALGPDDRIRSWGEASAHTRAIDRSAILSLRQAGEDLRQALDVLDRGAAGFMTGLLRANFVVDEYLTGLLLGERLGTRAVRHTYTQGQLIVGAGETVDRVAALALVRLARSGHEPATVATAPPAAVSAEELEPVSSSPPSAPTARARDAGRLHPGFLIIASTVGAFAMVLIALLRGRHRPARQRNVDPGQWLDEPGVRPAGDVREALIPHLARELKHKLVQALFAQRQELLHNEAKASERVAILEERLAKLQPAIAEKIRSYERRIQALEAELEEKDQETRDLIRAKLVLARQELDAEIHRHRIDWN